MKRIIEVYQNIVKLSYIKKLYLLFEIALVFLFFHDAVFPSKLTFISLLLVIILGALIVIKTKKMYYNPFLISFCSFTFIASVATLIVGKGSNDPIRRLALIGMQFLAALSIFNYLMNTKNIRKFMKIFAIVGILSLIIIFILLGDRAFTSRLGHNGASRTVSYFINNIPIYKSSNGTANICAISTLFLLFFANSTDNKKYKIIYYVMSVFLILGLLLCGSRKGFLVLFIFIIYSFSMLKISKRTKIITLIGIPIIVFILLFNVPFIYNSIGARIRSTALSIVGISNDLDQNSSKARDNLKDKAIEWISKKPILGYGFSSFEEQVGNGAENNILQIMLDFGIIGLLAYYSYIIPLCIALYKFDKKNNIIKLMSVLILCILLQDIGTVSYSWLSFTMWYSVFWATLYIENKKEKFLQVDVLKKIRGEKSNEE